MSSCALRQAVQLAAEEALTRPEDPDSALRVAKLLVLDRRPEEAFSLLEALPIDLRDQGQVGALHAHLALIVAMDNPPAVPPDRPEAERLFMAAAGALGDDDYETACTRLLASAQADPQFRNGLAARAAFAVAALPMAADVKTRVDALLRAPHASYCYWVRGYDAWPSVALCAPHGGVHR